VAKKSKKRVRYPETPEKINPLDGIVMETGALAAIG
jgi:hypothetical protein